MKSLAQDVFPLLTLPRTCASVIEAFSHPDVTAERVAGFVSKNPALEEQFLRTVQGISKRPDRPSLEGAIVLLGMQNSRNLLVTLQMSRRVTGKAPTFDSGGKVSVDPKSWLKYAEKIEDALGPKDKSGALETAFAAGVAFDLVHQMALAKGLEKTVVPFVDQQMTHALRSAQVARALAEVMTDFPQKKIAYSAALVHDIGKLVISIASPEYFNFLDQCAKLELPRDLRVYAETRRFGTHHAEVGARVLGDWPTLGSVSLAVLFHHRAQVLKAISKKDFLLAGLIHLSTKITSKYKQPENVDDPIFAQWLEPELKGFLPPAKILAALQNVSF